MVLAFGGAAIEVDSRAFTKSTFSKRLSIFESLEPNPPGLTLRLARSRSRAGEWVQFPSAARVEGGFRALDDGVELHPDVDERGALLALRILFARVVEAKGGILVHASCVEVAGRAALVTGGSGAGKSTIARWAQRAGARLLSDEVIGVVPDGRVLGTPFYSDPDLIGSASEAKLVLAMTLQHGNMESFSDLPAHHLVEAICGQAFSRPAGVNAREALVCIASALSGVRTGSFTCRDAPSAGNALVQLLEPYASR